MASTLTYISNLFSSHASHSRLVHKDAPESQSSTHIKEIVTSLVESLNYCPEEPIAEDNKLYQSLRSEFSAHNYDGNKWFDSSCKESATIAELSYPGHVPEVRLRIARLTWYLVYIDDLGQKFPSSLGGFQQRIFENNPQGDLLQAFREHLADLYQFWDPIPANCITLAAMDFINGCLLEQMPDISNMKLSEASKSWPYFLRNKTGCSAAYAFMLFPKHLNLNLSVYIQVIEDVILITNLVNDVLSFHKEYIAGETNNYLSSRSRVTQRTMIETLQDAVDDTLAAHARVTKILENTDAALPWKRYVNGYLAFHLTLNRYRLHELGF